MSASVEAVDVGQRAAPLRALDVRGVREEFPILGRRVRGNPLVYLDNAASTQKPRAVIDAVGNFYRTDYANIHRGVHELSQRATAAYEAARVKVQRFIHAADKREVVFVRGATEGINLVAQTYGRQCIRAGEEILITAMEHHANIVPWQMLCQQTGAVLRVLPVTDAGELVLDRLETLLRPQTRLLGIVHLSNAIGTVNPVRQIVRTAHRRGVPVLVDGAQAVPHRAVDVQELDCDFYTFSGHKLYGPSGIGVLYGKKELLEDMPPYQGGGEMIRHVTFEKTTYNTLPYKFEAGTPNIAGAVGLGAAIDFLDRVGLGAVETHERRLFDYAIESLSAIPGVRLIGTADERAAVISFVIDGVHPHDVGTILDHQGIAVRAGHHCAQPLMERLGSRATVRASLAMYNTAEEIDALVAGARKVEEVFR